MRIRITWDSGVVEAVLEPTPSAQKIWEVLPCTAVASTWGEEVYFELPVYVEVEPNARQVVEEGTLCFWVEGRSLALPYGPTPISQGDGCQLIAPVNVLGRIEGDLWVLSAVQAGAPIRVERIDYIFLLPVTFCSGCGVVLEHPVDLVDFRREHRSLFSDERD